MKYFCLVISVLFVFSSCRKEDDPMDQHLIGTINTNAEYGLQIGTAEMGTDYRYQSFFDLGTNTTVSNNLKTTWDLGFSCREEGYIILNSAKTDLRVAEFFGSWEDVIDTESIEFVWDGPTGELSGLSIGNNYEPVYVINRGLDLDSESFGFKKLRFSADNSGYTVTCADLNGNNEITYELTKDPEFNFLFLELDEGLVSVEPAKTDFDIYFSHYLYIYDPETEPFPYMVTGCLINESGVEVAEVFDMDYDDITISETGVYDFYSTKDIIGFDWKAFDFDAGFITFPEMNYIIKSTEGDFYKLHFTSFYNEDFEKGYPQFEFQKLQP